jgi:hypothetical protein
MMNFEIKKMWEISGELLHQELADAKLGELKKAEAFHEALFSASLIR